MSNEKEHIESGTADPERRDDISLYTATIDISLTSGSGSTTYSHPFNVEPVVVPAKSIDGDVEIDNKGSSQFDVNISNSSAGDGTYSVEVIMLPL